MFLKSCQETNEILNFMCSCKPLSLLFNPMRDEKKSPVCVYDRHSQLVIIFSTTAIICIALHLFPEQLLWLSTSSLSHAFIQSSEGGVHVDVPVKSSC